VARGETDGATNGKKITDICHAPVVPANFAKPKTSLMEPLNDHHKVDWWEGTEWRTIPSRGHSCVQYHGSMQAMSRGNVSTGAQITGTSFRTAVVRSLRTMVVP
jgi:hypothetical protein